MKRSKIRIVKSVISLILVVAVVGFLAVMPMLASTQEEPEERLASVLNGTADRRDISTAVLGAGTLAEETEVNVTIPSGVLLSSILVENGDAVSAGDVVALVDQVSVMDAITEVQLTLDALNEEIETMLEAEVTSTITAQWDGLVKVVYAQEGDSVQRVMLEHGALAILSVDEKMAVEIPTESKLEVGSEVNVVLSDGTEATGMVASSQKGRSVITVVDDGYAIGETVEVSLEDGTALGSGSLYINNPWNVTAISGIVDSIEVEEGDSVSKEGTLIELADTEAEYLLLCQQHEIYENKMMELFYLYEDGVVIAPCDGVISGLDSTYLLSADDPEYTLEFLSFQITTEEPEYTLSFLSDVNNGGGNPSGDNQVTTPPSGEDNQVTTPPSGEDNQVTTPPSDDGSGTFPGGDGSGTFPGGDGSGTFPGGDGSGTFPGGDGSGTFPGGDGSGTFPGGDGSGTFPGGDGSGTFPGGDGTETPGGDNPPSDEGETGTPSDGPQLEEGVVYQNFVGMVNAAAQGMFIMSLNPNAVPVQDYTVLDSVPTDTESMTETLVYTLAVPVYEYKNGQWQELTAQDIKAGDILLLVKRMDGSDAWVIRVKASQGTTPGGDGSGTFPGGDGSGSFPGGDDSGSFPGGDSSGMGSFGGGSFSGGSFSGSGDMPDMGEMGLEGGMMPEMGGSNYYALTNLTLLSITPQDSMTATITVDEMDLSVVSVGMSTEITLDALSGETITATVVEIGTSGTNSGGNSKFEVVLLMERSEDMLPGMNISASIPVSAVENVVTVPVAALNDSGAGTYLYTSYDTETGALGTPVTVTVGMSDGEYAQIETGLEEGQTFYYEYYEAEEAW